MIIKLLKLILLMYNRAIGSTGRIGQPGEVVEKEDAERSAWNASGVTSVESKLQIEVAEFEFEDW